MLQTRNSNRTNLNVVWCVWWSIVESEAGAPYDTTVESPCIFYVAYAVLFAFLNFSVTPSIIVLDFEQKNPLPSTTDTILNWSEPALSEMKVADRKAVTSKSRIKQIMFFTAACAFVVCTKLNRVRLSTVERDLNEQRALSAFRMPTPTTIPIFYNLFIEKDADIPRVSNFVRDQFLEFMKPGIHGPIFINSIGAVSELSELQWPPTINATLMNHYKQGDEVNTLQELWAYCSRDDTHPEQKVVYLHSKGSFHWNKANEKLRVYLTKGALSEECSNMPDTCNVCSSRMSPMPHPHTSGNMWLSRCEYVRKLIEPKRFAPAMDRTNRDFSRIIEFHCFGIGRYASEHCKQKNYSWVFCLVSSYTFILRIQGFTVIRI